jgi:hypothetical protein
MGFSKIKGLLTSRIGQAVRFGSPADVGTDAKFGRIIDEVWEDPEVNVSPLGAELRETGATTRSALSSSNGPPASARFGWPTTAAGREKTIGSLLPRRLCAQNLSGSNAYAKPRSPSEAGSNDMGRSPTSR